MPYIWLCAIGIVLHELSIYCSLNLQIHKYLFWQKLKPIVVLYDNYKYSYQHSKEKIVFSC